VAFLIFATIFSFDGIPVFLEGKARIGRVFENTPAAQAHVPLNYQIIGFAPAGTPYEQLPQVLVKADQIPAVQQFVADHRGQTWQVVLDGPCHLTLCGQARRVVELEIRAPEKTPAGEGAIGVRFAEYENQFYPWYEMPWRGVWFGTQQTVNLGHTMIVDLIKLVADLVRGKGLSSAVAGPIGIVYEAEKSGLSRAGWGANFNFAAMLSLNLAIMNLLPIPALDGGRIMLLLLEKVLGKARVAQFEGYVNSGGFFLLIGLLILISIRDVQNIFQHKG
jgi:regulator of sigma E protease